MSAHSHPSSFPSIPLPSPSTPRYYACKYAIMHGYQLLVRSLGPALGTSSARSALLLCSRNGNPLSTGNPVTWSQEQRSLIFIRHIFSVSVTSVPTHFWDQLTRTDRSCIQDVTHPRVTVMRTLKPHDSQTDPAPGVDASVLDSAGSLPKYTGTVKKTSSLFRVASWKK